MRPAAVGVEEDLRLAVGVQVGHVEDRVGILGVSGGVLDDLARPVAADLAFDDLREVAAPAARADHLVHHREDDLGQLGLVEEDYTWITSRIKEVAKKYAMGRIVSSLEGGYNLSALGRSVEAHLRVLADV